MFGPDPDADNACGYTPERGTILQEAHRERRLHFSAAFDIGSRSTVTVRSLISLQSLSSSTRRSRNGTSVLMRSQKSVNPRAYISSIPSFGMTKAHCQ